MEVGGRVSLRKLNQSSPKGDFRLGNSGAVGRRRKQGKERKRPPKKKKKPQHGIHIEKGREGQVYDREGELAGPAVKTRKFGVKAKIEAIHTKGR